MQARLQSDSSGIVSLAHSFREVSVGSELPEYQASEDDLQEEVDDHDDESALLDTSLPLGQIVVLVGVDDSQVDENAPENVNQDRECQDDHYLELLVLR